MSNKDHILNIRISRKTYEKIKHKARQKGETISDLVRSTIADGVEIIDDLSKDLFGKDTTSKQPKNIVSFHNGVLAQDTPCYICGTMLSQGQKVKIALDTHGKSYYIGTQCH